jgi:hypothetical protein
MKIWNKFCCIFSFLLLGAISSKAQTPHQPILQSNYQPQFQGIGSRLILPEPWSISTVRPTFPKILQINDKPGQFLYGHFVPATGPLAELEAALPSGFYPVSQMAFFCKVEMKFEKFTEVPLRVRVGSLQDNDWLEGKPGATPAFLR